MIAGRVPPAPLLELQAARAARLPRPLVVTAAAVVALQTVAHLGNRVTAQVAWLDVNGESTAFSVLSATVLMTAALLAAAGARPARRLEPSVLAGLLGFLALDELLAVHERVGVRAGRLVGLSEDWDSVLWPAVYVPLLLLVAVLLLRAAFRATGPAGATGRPRRVRTGALPPVSVRSVPLPPDPAGRTGASSALVPARTAQGQRAVVIGLLLLGAAVVLEVLSAPFSTAATADGLVHAVEGAVEEGCELAGWAAVALGLSRLRR